VTRTRVAVCVPGALRATSTAAALRQNKDCDIRSRYGTKELLWALPAPKSGLEVTGPFPRIKQQSTEGLMRATVAGRIGRKAVRRDTRSAHYSNMDTDCQVGLAFGLPE
jgi:hypothetical protein